MIIAATRTKSWLGSVLPKGNTLSPESWWARHRIIVAILWLHLPIVIAFAEVTGRTLGRWNGDLVWISLFGIVSIQPRGGRRLRASAATLGLMTSCAVLVNLCNGLTEMHFEYFVIISVIAFYQDWTTFLLAISFVLVNHGIVGNMDPRSMYGNPAAERNPHLWAGIHAFFIAAQSTAIIVYWRLAETAQIEALRVVEEESHRTGQSVRLESIGRLAGGIAHEINTPLQFVGDNSRFTQASIGTLLSAVDQYRALLTNTKLTAKQRAEKVATIDVSSDIEFLKDELQNAVDGAISGVSRVAVIVKAMKAFGRGDDDVASSCIIAEEIESDLIVASSEYRHIAAIETSFGDVPPIVCYVGELNQVIVNLLVNAAHAIVDRGSPTLDGLIKIATVLDGTGVRVSISDNGAGIPLAARPFVFDQFFTTKEVGRGTGQGLSLAYAVIVKRHGGRIWFETELGVGTTFNIWLPLVPTGFEAPETPKIETDVTAA